jgi:hypothetical protein
MCKQRITWIRAALLLGACCPGLWAKTLVVGQANTPCAKTDYTNITAAISAAASGDIIEICPALYAEQLLITKPLTLIGIGQQAIGRVLIQPSSWSTGSFGFLAVIAVVNTSSVTISNLAVDAGTNTVTGCGVGLAGIRFHNASGTVDRAGVFGTQYNPLGCSGPPALFPGNGSGIWVDKDANSTASFHVTVQHSSIHDFGTNGILVTGSGETADIDNNSVTGTGPGSGINQFGVFLADGATGHVTGNNITQGNCGTLVRADCHKRRSEGVVLRSVANVTVANNVISNVQAGIFVNGYAVEGVVRDALIANNTISNVDDLSAIHLQGTVSASITGNRIFHVGPFNSDTSSNEAGCGVDDVSGSGSSQNIIWGNLVNDAYCGVGYVTGDYVDENVFVNTLNETLNGDNYPDAFPPPVEPGQPVPISGQLTVRNKLQ